MDRFHELLLDVWAEACRHIEIEQSARKIARILKQRMPIDQLVVMTFDWDRSAVVVRAIGFDDRGTPGPPAEDHLLTSEQKALLRAWADAGDVLHILPRTSTHDVAQSLLRAPISGEWFAATLRAEQGPVGALLLRAGEGQSFEPVHSQMLTALREPFAVALDNDRRLHEINALREAAEADKRSALSRLGRTELSDIIVGVDEGLRPVMERVTLVARSDVPVLLLGETGTGKEVIARTIHEQSPRGRGPFIRVNCGAISPELIDSELFGHEKGAFTGATTSRRGWFERADEGTLLLDEIGELPLPAQVRLLRVLQEGTFERVGGEQSIKVDVRIIAATHRDLPSLVQNGKFREDVWYRICAFPIVLPPLRERRQDIPALAEHFAQRAARRFGLRPQRPAAADIALLSGYDWPGNIRELASVIDRAAILGDGHSLEIAKALGSPQTPGSGRVATAAAIQPVDSGQVAPLNDAMRRHIESVLRLTQGRIEGPRGAAVKLKINPHTLRARMRKLGIDWKKYR